MIGQEELLLSATEAGESVGLVHLPNATLARAIPGSVAFVYDRHGYAAAARAVSPDLNYYSIVDELPSLDRYLLRIPKSFDLFELMLARLAGKGKLTAVFYTRHFSPRLLEIASRYATEVSQSRAFKKSRLLSLDGWKSDRPAAEELIRSIEWNARSYEQWYGVFSAERVDPATRFLLERWTNIALTQSIVDPASILDIGSGSGIIGLELLRSYPSAALTAVDDSVVALASTRRNAERFGVGVEALPGIPTGKVYELIVTNPPFHDGHRNDIGPALTLFRSGAQALAPGGTLVVVANRHLNYATHLGRIFSRVVTLSESGKYVIYAAG